MESSSSSENRVTAQAPLVAAAAIVVGLVAARSRVGRLALLAAAGAAGYRWLSNQEHANPDAEPQLAQEKEAPTPTEFIEERVGSPTSAVAVVEIAPATVAEPEAEVFIPRQVTNLVTQPAIVFDRPVTRAPMAAPLIQEEHTPQQITAPISPELTQPSWALAMEPLPAMLDAVTSDLNRSLAESGGLSAVSPARIEVPVPVVAGVTASEAAAKPEIEPSPALPEAAPAQPPGPPQFPNADLTELLKQLASQLPAAPRPAPVQNRPEVASLSAVLPPAMEVLDPVAAAEQVEAPVEAPQPSVAAPESPPAVRTAPAVSAADLFANLAPKPNADDAGGDPFAVFTRKPNTDSLVPKNGPRPMIFVNSGTSPMRKNWLAWWK